MPPDDIHGSPAADSFDFRGGSKYSVRQKGPASDLGSDHRRPTNPIDGIVYLHLGFPVGAVRTVLRLLMSWRVSHYQKPWSGARCQVTALNSAKMIMHITKSRD
jgi:hypothetical protein